jgi:hypothetical protein
MTRPEPAATHFLHQPELPVTPASIGQSSTMWLSTLAKWVSLISSLYLIGPVTFVVRSIQLEASAQVWQADKRWANTVGSALLSLLWYVPVFVFHTALARLWTYLFATSAEFLRLPFVALLGGTTLWPPTPMNLLLRWLLALPCASLLACALEMFHPETRWEPRRVVSVEEALELAAVQAVSEKKRNASRTRRTSPAPVRGVAPRTPAGAQWSLSPGQQSAKPIPQGERRPSLWDQVDLSKVSDDDPVKRAALQEAERQAAEQRYAGRKPWAASQMSAQEQEPATKPSVPALPNEQQPSPAPTPSVDYDWDEGEGVVQGIQ